MDEQMLDPFRKAAESTIQVQQEMFRQWALQWSVPFGLPGAATALGGVPERVRSVQRFWAESVVRTLQEHRQALDAEYRAGIRTIEEAARIGQARDPEHFRQLVEGLWKQTFEALRSVTEAQASQLQAVYREWSETLAKVMATARP